jgi:hypothetical protein
MDAQSSHLFLSLVVIYVITEKHGIVVRKFSFAFNKVILQYNF